MRFLRQHILWRFSYASILTNTARLDMPFMKPVILIFAMLLLFTAIASCAPHRSETTSDRNTETPQICLTADVRPEIQELFSVYMPPQKPVLKSEDTGESSASAQNAPDTARDSSQDLAEDEHFMAALRQIKERKDELIDAKSDALLGETLSGRVGPVRGDVPEFVIELARSENNDREIVFKAIAGSTNHSTEEIARQYRIFMYIDADENHLLHNNRGQWVEKNKLDLENGDW